jgi:hypothetical protein
MKTSELLTEFAPALAKAQADFEEAERAHTAKVKTRSGGEYSYNYSDLAAVIAAGRKHLTANGISLIQEPTFDGQYVSTVTRLLHASGQWIELEPLKLPVTPVGEDKLITCQSVGSAITFGRRYSGGSAMAIASESDDDGNSASGHDAETAAREPMPECPECKSNKAVIRGKEEFGGGFVCWKKRNGCGKQWNPTDEATKADEAAKIASEKAKGTGPKSKKEPSKTEAAEIRDKKIAELEAASQTAFQPGDPLPIDDRTENPRESASKRSLGIAAAAAMVTVNDAAGLRVKCSKYKEDGLLTDADVLAVEAAIVKRVAELANLTPASELLLSEDWWKATSDKLRATKTLDALGSAYDLCRKDCRTEAERKRLSEAFDVQKHQIANPIKEPKKREPATA